MTTILIVDDHPIVRQGISQVLDQQHLADTLLQASNTRDAIATFIAHRPEIVILDLALGNDNGLDLIRELRKLSKDVRLLVLSMHDERDHAEHCLQHGADGYVMKQVATEQLVEALQKLTRGEVAISTAMQSALLRGHRERNSPPSAAVDLLSDKEREILTLLGQGLSSAEIAERRHRSIKTIEAHRAAIRGKLGLKTAAELIRFAALWTEKH